MGKTYIFIYYFYIKYIQSIYLVRGGWMQAIVRLEGTVEMILNRLVRDKYYGSKSEAVRAGILELGQKWHIDPREEADLVIRRMRKMEAEIKSGKKKVIPFRTVAREAGVRL